ncbi:unnamed protein product [marine sediment metagenome]|uniref:Uncharacterized protein n=1 Tax=marine sediment metagenome TaxID=412755 RepID=X1J6G4_9ZZZZ
MDINNVLTDEARKQGFGLNEPDDHILNLLYHGEVAARFSQTGVHVENILNEVQEVSKNL